MRSIDMTDTPGATFARRLRDERRAAGITQGELARRLSELLEVPIDATTVTKIEKGDRAVRLDEAVFAARVLNVPLAALVSEETPAEARLNRLRLELGRQQGREAAADAELRQAMGAVASIEREIEQLESSESR
jgi:transcriptional regulator with XRE-family HTH domain